jgi:hypothetical protein
LESNKGLGEDSRAEKREDAENTLLLLLLENSEREQGESRSCI